MASFTADAVLRLRGESNTQCVINPHRPCHMLDFDETHTPFAFIIFPTQWNRQKNTITEIIERHVRVQENGFQTRLNLRCFYDFQSISGNNFCNRICKPIQKSEFCIALCRHNSRILTIKDRPRDKVGKIELPNENVWWEVGIAMGLGKKVIVFLGKGQQTPTNFWNNIETQNLGNYEETETRLRRIFVNRINFGDRLIWV